MPEKQTVERARRAKHRGKAASTQAGEFVREEIHHIREGKHGARSTEQAIAIGLSKARRAGVPLNPPKRGSQSTKASDRAARRRAGTKPSRGRSRATLGALKRESRGPATREALASQARRAASRRGASERHAAARKAVRTKGASGRRAAARKAARTRARRSR